MNRTEYDNLAHDHIGHRSIGEEYRADCKRCKPKSRGTGTPILNTITAEKLAAYKRLVAAARAAIEADYRGPMPSWRPAMIAAVREVEKC